MAIKVIIGHLGKARTVELSDVKKVSGLKIGDTFKGELVDLQGYEFQITGGADASGFPMRRDVDGSQKRRILAVQGVGLKKKAKGIKQKKTVAGNTVHAKTSMLNVKVIKAGKDDLFAEPAEEPAAE
jgi:small subunit ribosomal protein S6e